MLLIYGNSALYKAGVSMFLIRNCYYCYSTYISRTAIGETCSLNAEILFLVTLWEGNVQNVPDNWLRSHERD